MVEKGWNVNAVIHSVGLVDCDIVDNIFETLNYYNNRKLFFKGSFVTPIDSDDANVSKKKLREALSEVDIYVCVFGVHGGEYDTAIDGYRFSESRNMPRLVLAQSKFASYEGDASAFLSSVQSGSSVNSFVDYFRTAGGAAAKFRKYFPPLVERVVREAEGVEEAIRNGLLDSSAVGKSKNRIEHLF